MKQAEFCYWLQGYFELVTANEITPLISISQKEVIRAHLELVKKSKKGVKPISGFCAWLSGALDVAPVSNSVIEEKALTTIRAKLADEFEHVIDPKVEGDKEELQATHDSPSSLSYIRGGGRIMC